MPRDERDRYKDRDDRRGNRDRDRRNSGSPDRRRERRVQQPMNYPGGMNPNILATINDKNKIKNKIYIPKIGNINFVGLLLGPKGTYQKKLELKSGCKILVRGE